MDPPTSDCVYPVSEVPLLDREFNVQRFTHYMGMAETAKTGYINESSVVDGSHPVIVLMHKVSALVSTRRNQVSGSVLYALVIRFLYTVCQAFPSMYLSTVIGMPDYLDHPVAFFHVPTSIPSGLLLLPIELLDSIFCHVPWSNLLRSRVVCRRWCQVATRFTHAHLVLRLSPDWQVAIVNVDGATSLMDDYALAQYVAMTYFIIYWGITPYVLSVSYVNWPCFCESTGCMYHNISSVSSPFMLPPSVLTVRLVRCSMQHHSIKRMLRYLTGLHTLELRGMLYGHMPLPEYSEEHGYRMALWRHDYLPKVPLYLTSPMRHFIVDFSADDFHPMNWLPLATQQYDWLYAQMFRSQEFLDALAKRHVQDGVFPLQLWFDQIMSVEIVVGRTMMPHEQDMWSVLSSLNMLKVVLNKKDSQYLSDVNIVLRPLALLKHLTVVFDVRDTARALRAVSTWSSRCRSKSDSSLTLVFKFGPQSRDTLGHRLVREALMNAVEGSGSGSFNPFKGKMAFDLVGDMSSEVLDFDRTHALSVVSSVGLDSAVLFNGYVDN